MALKIINEMKETLRGKNKTIVLPEGTEPRIIEAASRIHEDGVVKVILLGNPEEIKAVAKESGFNVSEIEIRDPKTDSDYEKFVEEFMSIRKGKATREQALELMKDENYFGTMMVQLGQADGMVSGSVHTTADTVRPALQIIKTEPGISRTSGAVILLRDGEKYLYADVAINTSLDAQQLGEIAIASGKNAKVFGIEPKIALLSYSTNGSAVTEETEKVAQATKIAKKIAEENGLDFEIDGEMQFDTAFSPTVANLKYPDSKVAGKANTYIFPNLEAGNIGYKIAQRLGNFTAVGPILQGLNKPVNDLSRGATVEDVYMTIIVTASQAL